MTNKQLLKQFASELGRRGGKAGTGDAKRRTSAQAAAAGRASAAVRWGKKTTAKSV